MLAAIRLQRDDNVVEVGPGLGALTYPLLDRLDHLRVIEIDRDLIARLDAKQIPSLTIVAGDVLSVDFAQLAAQQHPPSESSNMAQQRSAVCAPANAGVHPLRVVGNLPYNIGTPLLIRLLGAHAVLKDVHVMLQKEVVDRLHAPCGTRAYGRLSVIMQSVFEIEPLFIVPPEAFNPAPKVQSAVVRLKPRKNAPDDHTIQALQVCTRLAFANQRKTLRNNLKEHLDDQALKTIDINPQARAETLDQAAFFRLAKLLANGQRYPE